MSSFAFDCPHCGKLYERVKTSMAGRKVKCSCGKVFRLGPKTEAQKAESAARKSKKAARQPAERPTANPSQPNTLIPAPSPTPKPKRRSPVAPKVAESKPVSKTDDVLEAIPLDGPPQENDDNLEVIPVSPVVAEPVFDMTEYSDPAKVVPAKPIPVQPVPAQPIPVEPVPVEAVPVASIPTAAENVLEAVPIGAEEDDVFEAIPMPLDANLEDDLISGTTPEYFEPPNAKGKKRQRLVTPNPYKKKNKPTVKRYRYDDPIGGAIWVAAYGSIGTLIQLVISFTFSGSTIGRPAAVILVTKLWAWIAFACAIAIGVTVIYAGIEIAQRKRNTYPCMIAGFFGLAALAANALFCLTALIGISKGSGGASAIASLFVFFLLISLVPATAAITGFVRNKPEM